MSQPDEIRVLVVEDSLVTRRFLVDLINHEPDMSVIGEASDGEKALELLESLDPDVISMDISMPAMDGLEATRRIMAAHPTPIVVVSATLQKHDIVFSRVGSVDRNALVSAQEDGWLFSGRLLRIRPKIKGVFSPYLSYHFHDEPFKQRVRSVAVGQTMPSLNTQIMKNVVVALPPLPEQRAIAAVLSDMDAEIAALEARRVKTRALKQGMMRALLTGRIRLI